jgi:hypothetical protein
VLQHAWPGDATVLRDVPHEQDGQAALLRERGECDGHGARLCHPAGRALGVAGRHRLHRVDDEQVGAQLVEVAHDRAEVGLGSQVELVVHGAGALGPQAHLAGRLLARDVQHAAGPCRLGRHLEQERGLPDTRFAGQQHDGAGDEPTAQHAVQLGHPGGAGASRFEGDIADPARRRGGRPGGDARPDPGGRDWPALLQRAPGLAGRTAAHPLRCLVPTFSAAVADSGGPGARGH